jgi:HPt (histidine-containing phosphotransfer) domain-containing protein
MTELSRAIDTNALDELRESVGGDQEFFAELVDDFLADAPTQLESLRQALSAGDEDQARRAAHTLKGLSRTFGAGELASLCQEVEAAAAAGDLDTGLARIDPIDGEWARVRSELGALRDGPA